MGEQAEFRAVASLADALRLRRVRNALAPYMTGRTSAIGLAEQVRWFYGTYRPGAETGAMLAELVTLRGRVVGYGLVSVGRLEGWGPGVRGWRVSGGLLEEARGLGIGRALFAGLTAMAQAAGDGRVWLEVREGNALARGLYLGLGYREAGIQDRPGIGPVVLMVRDPKEQSARAANAGRGEAG